MMRANGFLVTGKEISINEQVYFGVDTEPWPLDLSNCSSFDYSEKEMVNSLYFQWLTQSMSVCLLNKILTIKYVKECIKNDEFIRVLYCETNAENILYDVQLYMFSQYGKFLGFDYAYGGDDYYSCILNDIIYRPTLFGNNTLLNEYGLIKNENELVKFVTERDKKKEQCGDPYLFEVGNFIVYKIYDVTENMLKTAIKN